MPARPDDRCPRCGSGFHCGAGGDGPCACGTLALGAELQQRLRERYSGCLCLRCLAALARGADIEPPGKFSAA